MGEPQPFKVGNSALFPSPPVYATVYCIPKISYNFFVPSIIKRPSFKAVTRCGEQLGEQHIQHPEDTTAQTSKYGLGLMMIMGGLYIGKKIFRK